MKQTIMESSKECLQWKRKKQSGHVIIRCRSLRQRERLSGSVKNVEQMQENGENIKPFKGQ